MFPFYGVRKFSYRRSHWPGSLRRGSARIVGSNTAEAWFSVPCECCVLLDKGLSDGPILCPEESYWMCVCMPLSAIKGNNNLYTYTE